MPISWNLDHFLSSGEGSSSYQLIPNLSLNAPPGLYQNQRAGWKGRLGTKRERRRDWEGAVCLHQTLRPRRARNEPLRCLRSVSGRGNEDSESLREYIFVNLSLEIFEQNLDFVTL